MTCIAAPFPSRSPRVNFPLVGRRLRNKTKEVLLVRGWLVPRSTTQRPTQARSFQTRRAAIRPKVARQRAPVFVFFLRAEGRGLCFFWRAAGPPTCTRAGAHACKKGVFYVNYSL